MKFVFAAMLLIIMTACTGTTLNNIAADGDKDITDGDSVDGDLSEDSENTDNHTVDGDSTDKPTTDGDTTGGDLSEDGDSISDGDFDSVDNVDDDLSDNVCTAGQRRCVNIIAELCTAGQWGFDADCEDSGQYCNNGLCQDEPACTPDEQRCNGQVEEHCNAEHIWTEYRDCEDEGQQCYIDECRPIPPKPGDDCDEVSDSSCFNNARIMCSFDLKWKFTIDCDPEDEESICWNGACERPSDIPDYPGCYQGDLKCEGEQIHICTANQSWTATTDCETLHKTCQAGVCVPK